MSGQKEDDNIFNIKRNVFLEYGSSTSGTVVRLNAGGCGGGTDTKLCEGKKTDEQRHFQMSYKLGCKLPNNNNNNKIEMRILVRQDNEISIFSQMLNSDENELLKLFPSTKVEQQQQPPQPEDRCLPVGIEKDDISSIEGLARVHKKVQPSHE